jgi:hypothetical protein
LGFFFRVVLLLFVHVVFVVIWIVGGLVQDERFVVGVDSSGGGCNGWVCCG